MKYPAKLYAEAFWEAMQIIPEAELSKLVQQFISVVYKNGDASHLAKIADAVEALSVKHEGGRSVELEYARPMPEKMAAELRKQFSPKDHIKVRINDTLVAGVRITIDGEKEIDNSLHKKLKRLFMQ